MMIASSISLMRPPYLMADDVDGNDFAVGTEHAPTAKSLIRDR